MRGSVIDDNELVQAVRKRILRELAQKREAAAEIHNVVNNSHGGGGAGGGLMERMNGGGDDPSDRDYFVDITREDLPDVNPATGKPKGWKKAVHRHSAMRGK